MRDEYGLDLIDENFDSEDQGPSDWKVGIFVVFIALFAVAVVIAVLAYANSVFGDDEPASSQTQSQVVSISGVGS